MKTSGYLLITLSLSACWLPARAQFYLDGLSSYNDGGIVSYYDNPGIVTSSGSYTALNGALTLHGGNTLQVDGPYTASGSSVDSFAGDGSATWPPVDATKTISGTTGPTFSIAKFNNGAGQLVNITNAQGINIAQQLDFANGITTTVRSNAESGSIHFADGATYTNSALGDAQHVNGYVSKTGDDAFTFPVGSGTDLRTLSMSAPATATDGYTVAWISGNPDATGDPTNSNAFHDVHTLAAGLAGVSTVGQWDWLPTGGATGAGLAITVSIPDLSAFATAADLRLVGWNGTQWVNLSTGTAPFGSNYASGTGEGGSLQGTMIAGIQAIGIGTISIPLPVRLLSFTANERGCEAVLHWETAVEDNLRSFELQHSTDGIAYTNAATIEAKGNGSSYGHTYPVTQSGKHYFRLKMTGLNNASWLSTVAGVDIDCRDGGIVVYPNPVTDVVTIGKLRGRNHITVTNEMGQLLRTVQTEDASVKLDLGSLPAALYLLQVRQEGGTLNTIKLFKK